MSTILVTGADGFVGSALSASLATHSHTVRAAVRTHPKQRLSPAVEAYAIGDLAAGPDWSEALRGIDCVVHLAGRAHVVHETEPDAAAAFHRINVEATTALFRASERAGVRRFVFVSSIGVLGVASGERPFTASSTPCPTEVYAVSKWQAERELTVLAAASATALAIVRPTLVCGPGARGNFERLVKLVRRGLPLPLASVRGRRNFVGLSNLCDLLALCCVHPAAAGQTFLAADPETYTTPQLVRAIGAAISSKPRLLPCPPSLLRLAGSVLGRQSEINRLTDSLLVDSTVARSELGWQSTRPLAEEIVDMARAVREA